MLFTTDTAKQFLLSKISEQAQTDGVALDETERKMFLFSESSGSPDAETVERFDREYNDATYEAKITKLLRRAYQTDKPVLERKSEWSDALEALRKEDFYGLVMVDQARIPRPKEVFWKVALSFTGLVPLFVAEVAVLAIGWLVVFESSRFGLYLSDWMRLVLAGVFVWAFWYVGRILGPSLMSKQVTQSGQDQS